MLMGQQGWLLPKSATVGAVQSGRCAVYFEVLVWFCSDEGREQ